MRAVNMMNQRMITGEVPILFQYCSTLRTRPACLPCKLSFVTQWEPKNLCKIRCKKLNTSDDLVVLIHLQSKSTFCYLLLLESNFFLEGSVKDKLRGISRLGTSLAPTRYQCSPLRLVVQTIMLNFALAEL